MEYRINIVRTEENPNYAKELENYERTNRYNNGYNPNLVPSPEITKNVLITVLTDEQYRSVQKAVLERF